uniref:Uncharacterized protein n=1 Tax=Arundo donax TaxID=35708 RepID=A0A0A8ZWP3_ARUDO
MPSLVSRCPEDQQSTACQILSFFCSNFVTLASSQSPAWKLKHWPRTVSFC